MIDNIKESLKKTDTLIIRKIPAAFLLFIIIPPLSFIFMLMIEDIERTYKIAAMSAITLLLVLTYFILFYYFIKKYNQAKTNIEDQIKFLDLIINDTNEMLILLDSFGRVVNFNPAIKELLDLDPEEIMGKPLRDVFSQAQIEDIPRLRQMLLDRFKEVFQGNEAEIISPVRLKDTGHYQTIHIKMKPKFKQGELDSIFVSARMIQSDYITNTWLINEKCFYVMSNDVMNVHIFCHRLTRNLDGKLDTNQVLFIQIALQEVLINAIEHGNLEISYKKKTELKQKNKNYTEYLLNACSDDMVRNRKVYIDYILEPDRVTYRVKDDGKGFEWNNFLSQASNELECNLLNTLHGIGLQIIINAFDETLFNEAGNEVTLVKYFNREAATRDA